jgi:hypothetical protein
MMASTFPTGARVKSFIVARMLAAAIAGIWATASRPRGDPPFTIKTMVIKTLWPVRHRHAQQVTDSIEKSFRSCRT